MERMELRKVLVSKLLQLMKTPSSIFFTPLGMVIDFRLLQPQKASQPIWVTVSGMLMCSNLILFKNVQVHPDGMPNSHIYWLFY